MQNEIYDEKNGLTYMLCGDYYLPELVLTDAESESDLLHRSHRRI